MPYHLSIPKGQAKHEESDLRNSAIRNLFEETGLTLSDIEWLDSIEPLQYEYKIYKDQVLSKKKVLAYYATLDKEKEIILSQKRGNIFWVGKAELRMLATYRMEDYLARHYAKAFDQIEIHFANKQLRMLHQQSVASQTDDTTQWDEQMQQNQLLTKL
jgi:8-oxo-dGTP pyrophosphatase MutT (NUDIX family)